MQKKKKRTPMVSMSLRSDGRAAGTSSALHQFDAKQITMLDSLLRKHYTIFLVGDGKYVYLAIEHWRYLVPVKEAPLVKLYKGTLQSHMKLWGKTALYLYDRSQFPGSKPF